MKQLLEDLETIMDYRKTIPRKEECNEYQRLHTFLTKLSEVDLEICNDTLNTLIKFLRYQVNETYFQELKNLLNTLKEVE